MFILKFIVLVTCYSYHHYNRQYYLYCPHAQRYGVVKGHQLVCNTHTVFEQHATVVCSYFSILLIIVLSYFFFLCVCHSLSAFFIFVVPRVCYNNLTRVVELVLSCPWDYLTETGRLYVQSLGSK